tara:strand:- start:105 stop:488 length:384 start_codon:yes stop_codon:yes gene_type:complete
MKRGHNELTDTKNHKAARIESVATQHAPTLDEETESMWSHRANERQYLFQGDNEPLLPILSERTVSKPVRSQEDRATPLYEDMYRNVRFFRRLMSPQVYVRLPQHLATQYLSEHKEDVAYDFLNTRQ